MSNETNELKASTEVANPLEPFVMPIQPIRTDERGVQRFVPNRIVEKLLETSTLDLNSIACMDFTQTEHEQLAQLIGYSVSGFGSLSYVSDETYATAEKMTEGKSELEARNEHLRETLDQARAGVKEAATVLFKIHPDDLEA